MSVCYVKMGRGVKRVARETAVFRRMLFDFAVVLSGGELLGFHNVAIIGSGWEVPKESLSSTRAKRDNRKEADHDLRRAKHLLKATANRLSEGCGFTYELALV